MRKQTDLPLPLHGQGHQIADLLILQEQQDPGVGRHRLALVPACANKIALWHKVIQALECERTIVDQVDICSLNRLLYGFNHFRALTRPPRGILKQHCTAKEKHEQTQSDQSHRILRNSSKRKMAIVAINPSRMKYPYLNFSSGMYS